MRPRRVPFPVGKRLDRLPTPGKRLTGREVEIVELIAAGLTDAQIGDQLYITANTVKSNLRRIMAKLGARGRAQVVHRAWQLGYLKPGGDDQ